MASVANNTLVITLDLANADLKVDYDIKSNSFDQNSNISYLETCYLIGKDAPPEDGTDDTITNMIGGLLGFALVSSNGGASVHRTRTKTIPKASLNEDVGTDEIVALVKLTPQLPATVSNASKPVKDDFS